MSDETTIPVPPDFAFAIRRVRGAVVVRLGGRLTGSAITQLEDVLDDLIRDQGNLTVVLDLEDLSAMGPGASALFSAAAGWARQRGGTLQLRQPSSSLPGALRITADELEIGDGP